VPPGGNDERTRFSFAKSDDDGSIRAQRVRDEHSKMTLAWLPYADRAEAERRLGGIPEGIAVDCYRADGDPMPDSVREVEFYVLPYMKGAEVLERSSEMTSLRVIQTLTAGVENFLPHVPDGVTLCNAAGVHDASTAELAVALTLASGRHLDDFARQQVEGLWQPRFGRALADQRVLIVGYGNIGSAIERRLAGFEVASVTRVARRGRPGPPEVHAITELDALLPDADVVIVIAPHTPETEGLIGGPQLARLPDDALVVNVARGALVDTDALAERLRRGDLFAAIDVFDREPLERDSALRSLPNAYLTDPRRAGRDRSGAAAARPPALAYAGRADLPAHGWRQLGLLPARRPPGRRPATSLRRR